LGVASLGVESLGERSVETKLWSLHGSLQGPAVWQAFKSKLTYQAKPLPFRSVDLRETKALDFHSWSKEFSKQVQQESSSKQLLIGYSLGGRLALHALVENPDLWLGAVIVSAHPGLASPEDREGRLKQDQSWAERFLNEPLDQVLSEWDELSLFSTYPNKAPRQETDFSKAWITSSFDNFSTGRQEDLSSKLAEVGIPPVLYLAGAEDRKYSELGKGLEKCCQNISFKEITQAAHRAPWDQPESFCAEAQKFIDSILGCNL